MDISKNLCDGERTFFVGMKEKSQIFLCKIIFVADLSGSQHLFQVLQTSLIFKNSENVVKSGCFEKLLRWKRQFFSEMKEGYKVSCVKILKFCKIIRRLIFI